MTALQKWLFGYCLEQYPEHGYHSYFGFIRYVPTCRKRCGGQIDRKNAIY